MKITLGSNIASLMAQRRLGESTNELSAVFERLSSGQRINRASDDAAGLAIADSLRADSRTLRVAERNINDGISVLNIMDGALAEQSNILVRLQELAEQSANGVYSYEQRQALNVEYRSLVDEFHRIGETTEFNGQKLLVGDREGLSEISLQVGIDSSSNSQISLSTIDSATMSGVVNNSELTFSQANGGIIELLAHITADPREFTIEEVGSIGGTVLEATGVDDSARERNVLLVAFGDFTDELHFVPFVQSLNDSEMWETMDVADLFLATNLGDFGLKFDANGNILQEDISGVSFDVPSGTVTIDPVDSSILDLKVTGNTFTYGALPGQESTSNIELTRIDSASFARGALDIVGERLNQISYQRSELGGVQSRLSTALVAAGSSRENVLSAESRIRDADIAFEAARLSKQQILQQVGASVLSQANQQPSLALQLLS